MSTRGQSVERIIQEIGNNQSELNLDLIEKLENQASFKSKLIGDVAQRTM